jgi:hypothetical protein
MPPLIPASFLHNWHGYGGIYLHRGANHHTSAINGAR